MGFKVAQYGKTTVVAIAIAPRVARPEGLFRACSTQGGHPAARKDLVSRYYVLFLYFVVNRPNRLTCSGDKGDHYEHHEHPLLEEPPD